MIMKTLFFLSLPVLTGVFVVQANADVTLVSKGKAQCAIYVAPRVMADDEKPPVTLGVTETSPEEQRQRLRESVKDLALYLGKMSGAKVPIVQRAPQVGEKAIPIYIGELATRKFGAVGKKSPFAQAWRMTVSKNGVGLQGESDESASYAIYEVLDRLNCRWFLPGELGEVIPHQSTLRLAETDISSVPSTLARNVWYPEPNSAYARRNRLTKMKILAEHALEFYITEEQRKQHPEWRAIVNGEPSAKRLKWSNPEVANAIGDAIIANLDKKYQPSVSISPDDGVSFDESPEDRALDAGDFDPSMDQISITDRYIVLCNRIAERVTKKYPDVRLGFLAYVQYTRPPVREKLHPNLVPEIAPISYCRAHSMTDTHVCPSRAQLRYIVEGWAKAAPQVAYYNYMYHLAEVTVPYPMIHQMKTELPILYKNHLTYWQPETVPNLESVLPGMWLSLRMAWNKDQSPDAILDDFYTRFYGAAANSMKRYWQTTDDAWTNSPEHAGSFWGHARRFTPEVLDAMRAAMNSALHDASTPMEYQRVALQDKALRQFERLMQMRRDLNEGHLANLNQQVTQWYGTQIGLGNEYIDNAAFGKTYWASDTVGGTYFKWFADATLNDAGRIAREYSVITPPLRDWKYAFTHKPDEKALPKIDGVQQGENAGWQKSDFNDAAWKRTDIGIDTWADLNLLDSYGTMWYRSTAKVPAIAAGKKVFLWLSATDGSAKVFVNGVHVPYVNAKGEKVESASGYAAPFSFDITSAIKPNAENQITIAATRIDLNELGTGGLLGPVYLYVEK
jgi:hypothetical protein